VRVIAVIQARVSSRRLPGKVLRRLCDKPVIGHLCDGLSHSRKLDGYVIATSSELGDDAIADYAQLKGIPYFRGSLAHVADRMLAAASHFNADALVRVCGDSPLLDPKLVDQAVELFLREPVDLVTNVLPRSFPKGQSVEVMTTAALAEAVTSMSTADEREHVTFYLYAHSDRFVIRSFTAAQPRPEVQLSIDTAEDFARCEAILKSLRRPPWQAGWEACVAEYDALAATGGDAA
jgi:spore coat polysaccharide biosynthesis protein SpsF